MDFNTLNKQRKFIMIAAVIGIIGMFLTWFKIGPFTQNGMHGAGIVVFLAFAASAALSFLGDQKLPLPKNSWLIVLGAAAVALLIVVINIFTKGGTSKYGVAANFVKLGIGIFLALAGAAGVLASAYMFKGAGQDLKQSLNEMKKNVANKLDGDPNT